MLSGHCSFKAVTPSVREAVSPADKALSLEIYNLVVPHEAVTEQEVTAWYAAADATLDLVASVDGEDVGRPFARSRRNIRTTRSRW
jgi:hypothetical protein